MHITEIIHKDLGDTILVIRRKKAQIKANIIKLHNNPNPIQKEIIQGNTDILHKQNAGLKLECEVFIKDLSTQIELL